MSRLAANSTARDECKRQTERCRESRQGHVSGHARRGQYAVMDVPGLAYAGAVGRKKTGGQTGRKDDKPKLPFSQTAERP